MNFLPDRITARLGVWEISGDGPQRIPASDVDLESNLEKWIARDPDLGEVLGQDGWHYFGDEEVERFTAGLKELIIPEFVPD